MKWIKRILLLIVLLIFGGTLAGYLLIDGIVKTVVQDQGSEQLNVKTTLGGVSLGLIHGTVDLDTLAIGSPKGFTAPQMFSVGKLAVDTGGILRLRDEPIHLASITIDQPTLVIEQQNGKLNFRVLMDDLPKRESAPRNAPKRPPAKQPAAAKDQAVKVIIDTLTITNAHVMVQAGIPGLSKQMEIGLPAMTMKNIGNADGTNNGAALKDVATAVICKMVDQTSLSGLLPIDATKSLKENLGSVAGKLDQAAQQQLDKLKIPVDVGALLQGIGGKK